MKENMSHIMSVYAKPHNIHEKYIDSVSDWPCNFPAAKDKGQF